MRTFSITLPNELADSSQRTAHELGLSRAQFIRMAIGHELRRIERQLMLDAMADSFAAMRDDPNYMQFSEDLDNSLTTELPDDKDEWWTGK